MVETFESSALELLKKRRSGSRLQLLSKQALLLERIRKGNNVLWASQDKSFEVWKARQKMLEELIEELAATGWDDCAYEPRMNPPKHICFGCTMANDTWKEEKCPAWSLEEEVKSTNERQPRAQMLEFQFPIHSQRS